MAYEVGFIEIYFFISILNPKNINIHPTKIFNTLITRAGKNVTLKLPRKAIKDKKLKVASTAPRPK